MTNMQTINNSDFSFIHIRPGLEGKQHPIATIAVHLVPVNGRFGVALASQHVKKDEKWDAKLGRFVAAGRASRSRTDRVFIGATGSRRDLIINAVERVHDAIVSNEIRASRKVTRAIVDTLNRLHAARAARDFDNGVTVLSGPPNRGDLDGRAAE